MQPLDTGTMVGRRLIMIIVAPVLCGMVLVVYASYGAGYLEFTHALPRRDLWDLPQLTDWYRSLYAWGWFGPALSSLAAIVLVCRRQCTIGSLASLIGFMVIFTTFWLVFTLLALYIGNQKLCAEYHATPSTREVSGNLKKPVDTLPVMGEIGSARGRNDLEV